MKTFYHTHDFTLESGYILPGFKLGYQTFGELNSTGTNVIWVFHALTANTAVNDWWKGLFGTQQLLNPDEYFIVCVNMPGSCYGSLSPLDKNPKTGLSYFRDFPLITLKDMVNMYDKLRVYLGIHQILLAIGGSMGGMQAIEYAIAHPTLISKLVLIATNAKHSAWGIAFNATQRLAIEADQTWYTQNETGGINGLKAARAIAMLSYRNYYPFKDAQSENTSKLQSFKAESYQYYQGEKLTLRFNAFSYYALTKSMDAHDVGRNRNGTENALQQITAQTLVIGIESDLLFPPEEQLFLFNHIKQSSFKLIDSLYGHDGFLIESEQISQAIKETFPQLYQIRYGISA
ncbi:MAG: homoserine O-acetyltransferase [Bacteroidia bacterium]|jgi:homoserine O-acetyltransferase|nr:homoserine O-acetyltransferase [Bacteroidia bacterium]